MVTSHTILKNRSVGKWNIFWWWSSWGKWESENRILFIDKWLLLPLIWGRPCVSLLVWSNVTYCSHLHYYFFLLGFHFWIWKSLCVVSLCCPHTFTHCTYSLYKHPCSANILFSFGPSIYILAQRRFSRMWHSLLQQMDFFLISLRISGDSFIFVLCVIRGYCCWMWIKTL